VVEGMHAFKVGIQRRCECGIHIEIGRQIWFSYFASHYTTNGHGHASWEV